MGALAKCIAEAESGSAKVFRLARELEQFFLGKEPSKYIELEYSELVLKQPIRTITTYVHGTICVVIKDKYHPLYGLQYYQTKSVNTMKQIEATQYIKPIITLYGCIVYQPEKFFKHIRKDIFRN